MKTLIETLLAMIPGTEANFRAVKRREKRKRDNETRIRLETYAFEYLQTPECQCYNNKALLILREHFGGYYRQNARRGGVL